LRKVYGPVSEQDFEVSEITPLPEPKNKLRELYKTPDSVADIKKKRFEKPGSVTRVDQTW
jgi:hypothetical protein